MGGGYFFAVFECSATFLCFLNMTNDFVFFYVIYYLSLKVVDFRENLFASNFARNNGWFSMTKAFDRYIQITTMWQP